MKKELTVDAKVENLYYVIALAENELKRERRSTELIANINICVEEIFVNIASYAYGEEMGVAEIVMELTDTQFSMTFCDYGTPYNPLEHADPDLMLEASEREIGGLGIFMVKEMMDQVSYEYKEGKNCLTIVKSL